MPPQIPPATEFADSALAAARRRGRADAVPYAGKLTPPEAWALASQGLGKLIDVRSPAETRYVGHVPGSQMLEWRGDDARQVDAFVTALRSLAAPDDTLLFLCRSGARSHKAALAAAGAGFENAFNVIEGFEGQRDEAQQRGRIDGWRKHGLPWVQD